MNAKQTVNATLPQGKSPPPAATDVPWFEQTFDVLREFGIRQIPYLPDGGLAPLIEKCAKAEDMIATALTTEEEGVMLIAGAWLGGNRAAMLIQSSGVGNCVNAFSLLSVCTIPCVMVVTMRGVWGEFSPWQVPMGKAARGCFELLDFAVLDLERQDEATEVMRSACQLAYGAGRRVAVLVSQRMLGAKTFTKAKP
jgi:sulfopyruvate decarboxylase TPP-binding subunit